MYKGPMKFILVNKGLKKPNPIKLITENMYNQQKLSFTYLPFT